MGKKITLLKESTARQLRDKGYQKLNSVRDARDKQKLGWKTEQADDGDWYGLPPSSSQNQTTQQQTPAEETFDDLIVSNYDEYIDSKGKTYYGAIFNDGKNSAHFYSGGKIVIRDENSKVIGKGTYDVDGPKKRVIINGITGFNGFNIENQTQSYKDYLKRQETFLQQQKDKETQQEKELSEKTPKENLNSYSNAIGFYDWTDVAKVETRVDKILELANQGNQSTIFNYFYKALELASQVYSNRKDFYDSQIIRLQNVQDSRNPSEEDIKLNKFERVDLSTTGLWPSGFYYFKPFGTKTTLSMKNIIDQYKTDGWQDRGGKALSSNEISLYDTIDLKDYEPETFKESYILIRDILDVDTDEIIKEISRYVLGGDLSIKSCKKIIGRYYSLFKQEQKGVQIPITQADLIKFKNAVNRCDTKHTNFYDFNMTNHKLEDLKKPGKESIKLSLNPKTNTTQVADSYKNLKKTIKENLITEKEKKEKLLTETKIIENRLEYVIESVGLKNKSDVDRIVEGLFYEMLYLENKNYNREVLTENIQAIFDVLGSLFGGTKDSVVGTFKEKGINFILNKLGLDKNSYIGDFLEVTFGNIDLKDIPRLFTDCEFLTKKIAEAVPEAYLKNLQDEKGFDNILMDYVRNALYDVIRESDIVEKLEDRIAGIVCPITASLTGKFEEKLTDMKSSLS